MSEIMQLKDQLIEAIKTSQPKPLAAGESVIEIHGALRHLTAFYERLRQLIDYQEERFIRRLAIRRILFRRILIEGDRKPIGEALARELIRAAYIENAKYPTRTAMEIDEILKKYLAALPAVERRYQPPELIRMQRRLLGIAAAEIEDYLTPAYIDRVLAERLAVEIASYTKTNVTDDIRLIALRQFLKADAELATWRLTQRGDKTTPGSLPTIWEKFVATPGEHVSELLREIVKCEFLINDRRIEARVRHYQRLTPPYILLADLAYERAKDIHLLADQPDKLDRALASLLQERLEWTEGKLHRAMIRATVYIFITKVIIGIALEIPYDLSTMGHIAYLPVIINILVPPLLMVIAALSIRPPSSTNNEILLKRSKMLFNDGDIPFLVEFEGHRPRSGFKSFFNTLFYFAAYVVSFGGVIWVLNRLSFNIASMLVFLFFISVVGFFAFRIRASAKEMAVIRESEGIAILIFDFFALPFLRIGRWLSVTVRQINVVLFVLDFLIEAPLKVVFVAIEDWFAFLREKREELS
ncbi:MAG: hypothetical protein AAB647_03965 [Patescibacteria group bacterium]